MRYALRNQNKIIGSLGSDFLKILISSLDLHFKNVKFKEEFNSDVKPYPVITIDSVKSGSKLDFHIIGKKFDVYTLAYKPEVK